MEKSKGHYIGTEIGEKWWKRYRKSHFFARGLGEYWQDQEGFYFLRRLTAQPIFIPFRQAIAVKIGTWHAGRWAMGRDIIKIIWENERLRLSSGFIVAGGKKQAHRLKENLERMIEGKKTGGTAHES